MDLTTAEASLWEQLWRRRFPGHRFRRQHPMGGYIVDFFCHSLRLVIEIDGAVHALQRGYDAERDGWIRAQGYTVLRFTNEKVLGDLEEVMHELRSRGLRVQEMELLQPDLEEVFLKLTGASAGSAAVPAGGEDGR